MKNYYIFSNGIISRRDNTIVYNADGEKKYIPVNDVESIFIFGESSLNTKFLNFISRKNICVHFFNYYGYYSGSYYPREFLNSGKLCLQQAAHILDDAKRIIIAGSFVRGSVYGIEKNLSRYKAKSGDIVKYLSKIKGLFSGIEKCRDVSSLMGLEGNIRENYYKCFSLIMPAVGEFKKRVYHPPDNKINALISFLNSLVYTTVLSEIYKTQLSPTLSFLHSPSERRFSLALDIAEIFKPLLADRILFRILNKNEIGDDDFVNEMEGIFLKEKARKKILSIYDERINKKIFHKSLKKKVRYKTLIRLECYKLIKHLLGDKDYKVFKMWW